MAKKSVISFIFHEERLPELTNDQMTVLTCIEALGFEYTIKRTRDSLLGLPAWEVEIHF